MVRRIPSFARRTRVPCRIAFVLLPLAAAASPAVAAPCSDLLPSVAKPVAKPRPITADDLLRLRDIGQPDGSMVRQPTPLSVSPDGKQAAFILTRADPATNSYCRGVVVVRLDGPAEPKLLDTGGELIVAQTAGRGSMIPVGIAAPVVPRWSPDGRWIAYLRRDRARTRLWRVAAAGGTAAPVGPDAVDIDAFAWSADGRRLLIARRPAVRAVEAGVDAEALGGWLYDARILPNMGARPLLPAGLAVETDAIDLQDGTIRPADAWDRDQLDAGRADDPLLAAQATGGRRAWTKREGEAPMSPLRLFADNGRDGPVACTAAACDGGLLGLWWDASGEELRFLRREGWAKETMAFYRWRPGKGMPRPILRTGDVLIGCVPAGADLLCLRENALTPRHLVRIDLATGQSRLVYDPNPEFAGITLGTVERLRWRNDRGLEAWGDLVLPANHRPGEQLPLIVVQYHSDGFLRGGTGDEYPIQLFAAHGFAVLSVERAAFVAESVAGVKTWDDFNAANMKDWAERRSLLSSLLTGVGMAIARGDVDPKRIGITGLSDGASTARFALINSRIFAAAAISSCCMDPKTVMTQAGIAFADMQRRMGAPPATGDASTYWRPYSLALNADHIDTPLLMQLADEEYLLGLETFTALREKDKPVEMHIFPGEHHMKWQPAHRRAIYERNLDWFAFWLQWHEDPDPAKAAQYRRWEAMRAKRVARAAP
ncbi:Atxe2 family lasso peptide isopeptidase [Sphingomonas sanxanigenens]|uniref:Atxe2 family lasso peptide isopeptidase n=1 Tax=Sphingomonas sanxanigenens TaxID=397260 RepID=UPI0004ADFED2|nr:Atxe2 family lasso peptide isopeptidase [Sphingomonas sanxanigenens]